MVDNTINTKNTQISSDYLSTDETATEKNQTETVVARGALSSGNTDITHIRTGGSQIEVQINHLNSNPALEAPRMYLDIDTLTELLTTLKSKMTDISIQNSMTVLNKYKAALKDQGVQKMTLLTEQLDKQTKEVAKQKKSWIARLFMAIFAPIVAIAAAVATVATAGAASPLLVALTVGLAVYTSVNSVLTVVNMVREKEGKSPIATLDTLLGKFLSVLLVEPFVSDEKKAETIGSYLAAAFIFALNIAAIVSSFGTKLAADIPALLAKGASVLRSTGAAAQAVPTIVNGVYTVQIGDLEKAIAKIQAIMQKNEAYAEMLQAWIDETINQIEEATQSMQSFFKEGSQILADQYKSIQAITRNMA